MEVILAETLGFCGGVKKAVNLMYKTVKNSNNTLIYMEGPIIHNRIVIEELEEKGVQLLNKDHDIKGAKVVVRAHGVSPEVHEDIINRGAEVVDGTCPIVLASQIQISKHAADGYFVVIAGDKGHAEVIGLVGHAKDRVLVVGSVEDLKGYTFPLKTLLISQTTFSKPEFYKIEEALKRVCPSLKSLCTICGATKERQDAVITLAKKVDALIVVGGLTSSNTKRLKLAAQQYTDTWLIESAADIPKEIVNYSVVGVSAGASTPDSVISEVVEKLKSL
ncbi:MAG: 4-hydroxy-3-methylbut-2-enyl diphosphate reductase [Spirochaetaceae bacterium 4572_7]|nr:MAG: 4-hydroxy-3-methylbut-2-enyl diphosphate reductase [Spirochaetaceae bacterium 4572_7]